MAGYRKVVWNEGMRVGPHHFQQWDNYYEDLLNSRLASMAPYEWGVLELQVSREAITNGSFELTRCRAVMPDGLLVDVGETDIAPPARQVGEHFDPEAERLDVYLAVPLRRAGAHAFQANGDAPDPKIRYWQDAGRVKDETTGDNERTIALARSNLRLLFGGESLDGYSAVKLAEVTRTATGQLTLSDMFVPPALDVAASKWLVGVLRQLLEVLINKSSTLSDRRRQRGSSLVEFTTPDVAVFWQLHTVNSAIPRLAHLFRTPNVHPERLYYEMVRLAGELMTFAPNRHPKDIITYDHKELYETFSRLAADIREMLEIVIPTNCFPIPLDSVRESVYAGRIHDERLLTDADFYLAVRATGPVDSIIRAVPRTVKVASRDAIDHVIASAIPALALSHVPQPPASITPRVGFQYFALDCSGPFWDDIKGSKTLAVYVPDEIHEEKVEVYAVTS
jgi:type VI secretion system protein ImpJ